MDTPTEYSDSIHLIQQHHQDNIGWAIRLTNGYAKLIFIYYPPNKTASPRQYYMGYQASQ